MLIVDDRNEPASMSAFRGRGDPGAAAAIQYRRPVPEREFTLEHAGQHVPQQRLGGLADPVAQAEVPFLLHRYGQAQLVNVEAVGPYKIADVDEEVTEHGHRQMTLR